jgi:phosphoglycerate dehydrogenase-like enzyme
MKVLVSIPEGSTRNGFLDEGSIKILEDNFDVVYNETGKNYNQAQLAEAIKDVDVLITGWGFASCIDGPLHDNTSLKMIAHTAGSVGDLVDAEAYDKGITIVSGNKLFAESVAEGTIAYMMAALRKIPTEVYGLKEGLWRHPEVPATKGLLDREIGIIGYGMISQNLMKMLQVFRCRFKIYSQFPMDEEFLKSVNATKVDTLEEIFSTCSIVSLHSALNEKTRNLIGKEHFDLLPEGALFVNTARGAIIRQKEMEQFLVERPDVTAILDVYAPEPPEADNVMRSLKNVYLMPHRGGPTNDRYPHIGRKVVEDIVHFAKGEPLELEITREYASRMTKQSH